MSVVSKFNSGPAAKMISEKAKKRLLAIGFSIEREAKLSCTEQGVVDTGRLRASISTNWTGSGMDRGKTATIGAGRKSTIGGAKNEYQRQLDAIDPSRASVKLTVTSGNEYQAQLEAAEMSTDGIGRPPATGDRFLVVVGSNVFYAPFNEFGTSKMGARPFLRPAFEKYKTMINKK